MGSATEDAGGVPSSNGRGTPQRLTQSEFVALFEASAPTLWCIAAGVLGERNQADDVLQEAAMIALRKLDQFDANTNFMAWAGRIVRYVALNTRRARRRSLTATVDPVDLEHMNAAPRRFEAVQENRSPVNERGELTLDQDSFDDQIAAALHQLSPSARACLLLRTVREMSYREIALALSIPEGTVMSHVHRARKYLRARAYPGDEAATHRS